MDFYIRSVKKRFHFYIEKNLKSPVKQRGDSIFYKCNDFWFLAEIKPLLGDDYPCILRKMKNQIELTNNYYKKGTISGPIISAIIYVLFIKEYNSNTTSKDELKQIFRQSRIVIIYIDELL